MVFTPTKANELPTSYDPAARIVGGVGERYVLTGVTPSEVQSANANGTVNSGYWIASAGAMLLDIAYSYTAGPGLQLVTPGSIVQERTRGFSYVIAGSGATDHHRVTAGGVRYYVEKTAGGALHVDAFGAVGDNTADDTSAILATVAAAAALETIQMRGGAIYKVSAEIAITKPIHIDMNWATLRPTSGYTGYLLSVNSTKRGTPNNLWYHPTDSLSAGKTLLDNCGFALVNFILEGNKRLQVSNGLIFRGGNSDVLLQNGFFRNFKGTGIAACDPASSTGDDATNQFMQECLFENVSVNDCGDTGKPSYIIGRNANGGSAHNNLRHRNFNIEYARKAPAILMKNAHATARLGRVSFDSGLIHGNRSLAANDLNGEATAAASNLIQINDVAPANPVEEVLFTDVRVIEPENTYSGIAINGDTDVIFNSGQLAAGAGPYYGMSIASGGNVFFAGQGLEYENLIRVTSGFSVGKRLTIGATSVGDIYEVPNPNLVLSGTATLDDVIDTTRRTSVWVKDAADGAAATATGITMIDIGRAEILLRAWFVPTAALVADDTNYATIILRPYNANGTARATHSATTKTIGGGGLGGFTAQLPVNLNVPSNTRTPGGLAIQITKQGTGVVVPQGTFLFEFSRALYT